MILTHHIVSVLLVGENHMILRLLILTQYTSVWRVGHTNRHAAYICLSRASIVEHHKNGGTGITFHNYFAR